MHTTSNATLIDTQAKMRLFNKRLVLSIINQCNFRREEATSKGKEGDVEAYAYMRRDSIAGQLIAFLESPEANALTSPDEVMARLKMKLDDLQKAGYSQKDIQLIEFNILGYFKQRTAKLQSTGISTPGATSQNQLLYEFLYEQAKLTSQPSSVITTNSPPLFTHPDSGVNPNQAVKGVEKALAEWHTVGIRKYDKDKAFNNFVNNELVPELNKDPVSLKAYTSFMITMNLLQDYLIQVNKIMDDKKTYPTEEMRMEAIANVRQELNDRMKPDLGAIAECINNSKMIGGKEESYYKSTDFNSLRAIYEYSKHIAIQVECKALNDPALSKQLTNINTSIAQAKFSGRTEYHDYDKAKSERSEDYYKKVVNYIAMQQKDQVEDANYFANQMRANMQKLSPTPKAGATTVTPMQSPAAPPPRPATNAPPRPVAAAPTTTPSPVTKPGLSKTAKPEDYFAAVIQAGIDMAVGVDLTRVIQNGLLPKNKDAIIALVKTNFNNNKISYDEKTLAANVEASIMVFDNFNHYLTKLLMNDPKLIQLCNNLYGNDTTGQPNFNAANLTLAFDYIKALVSTACVEFDNFFDKMLQKANYQIPNATDVMRKKGDTSPNPAEWMKSGFLMHIGTFMALSVRHKTEVEQPTNAELMIPQLFSALHAFTHNSGYQDKKGTTLATQLANADVSSIIPALQNVNAPAAGLGKPGKISGIFNQANIDVSVVESLFPKSAPTASTAATNTAIPQAAMTTTSPSLASPPPPSDMPPPPKITSTSSSKPPKYAPPSPPKSTTPTSTPPQGSPRELSSDSPNIVQQHSLLWNQSAAYQSKKIPEITNEKQNIKDKKKEGEASPANKSPSAPSSSVTPKKT